MKVLIFGVGKLYELYKKYFYLDEVIALLDNDKKKQGKVLDGIKIYHPKVAIKLKYDRIYILNNRYYQMMKEQLLDYGIQNENIFTVFDLKKINGRLVPYNIYHPSFVIPKMVKNNNRKKILLITNELWLTGAPMAIFYAAVVLEKNGYDIYVLSPEDGPLKKIYLQKNITVIIDRELKISRFEDIDNIHMFDLVIVNTFVYYYLFMVSPIKSPVIWWVHEAKDNYLLKINDGKKFSGIKILAGGNVARDNFNYYCPGNNVNELLYGIPDTYIRGGKNNKKVIFALVGTLCERKGQDIFLDAIAMLPMEILDHCEFLIVGKGDGAFGNHIKKCIKSMKSVYFINGVDHDKLIEIYQKISVLVCPSREDPMPVVVTEAMMSCKPVLVAAEGIGNAEFIRDGVNGLLFDKENAKELAKKIIWCYQNREKLSDIGKRGRKIYENYFTLEKFEENLLNIVKDKIE